MHVRLGQTNSVSVSVLNHGTDLIGTGGREGEIPFGGLCIVCIEKLEREKNGDGEGRERGTNFEPNLYFSLSLPCNYLSSIVHLARSAATVGRGLQSMMRRPSYFSCPSRDNM